MFNPFNALCIGREAPRGLFGAGRADSSGGGSRLASTAGAVGEAGGLRPKGSERKPFWRGFGRLMWTLRCAGRQAPL